MEKRTLRRRFLILYLPICNIADSTLIGHLVDITIDGLMLISQQPQEPGQLFPLKIMLPEGLGRGEALTVDARSAWCKKDVNPSFYAIGFQFTHILDENQKTIESLIREFGFDK